MSPLSLVVFIATGILNTLIPICEADAPIIWPDPRLFKAAVDPANKVYIKFDWPIIQYLKPDYLKSCTLIIKQVENANYSKYIELKKMSPIKLDSSNAEYFLTLTLKTAFYPQGVSASVKLKTGGKSN